MNRFRRAAFAITIPVLAILTILTVGIAAAIQETDRFPDLRTDQRIYDETGSSLTPNEIDNLEQQLDHLEGVGAYAVLYVRNLMATPNETLDQVEALQQQWVTTTSVDQDSAVAMLINRNPDDEHDARAGIYVGSSFDDGNVPTEEQKAIVAEEMIPPLRDGDVFGSFSAGLERMETSIVEGPPQGRAEKWASDAASTWLPWASAVTALAGLSGAVYLYRRRPKTIETDISPTTNRPGDLPPALGAALALSGPQLSAVPATLLDLAVRDAIAFEPEGDQGISSESKVQVKMLDATVTRNDFEKSLWNQLESHSVSGVVSNDDLSKIARAHDVIRSEIEEDMRNREWTDEESSQRKRGIALIAVIAAILGFLVFIVSAIGEEWRGITGAAALGLLALVATVLYSSYSNLTPAGQSEAIPWRAYRKGLEEAASDLSIALNLDTALADGVAMNIGNKMSDRVERASRSGIPLKAFESPDATVSTFPIWMYAVLWSSMTSTMAPASVGSTVVSSGGAGGGGGAAAST